NFLKISKKYNHQTIINSLPNPANIVSKLRDLNGVNTEEWNNYESEIIENIHFFDADQYTDIVYLYGKNNTGSYDLWDLLSRKLFDYDFDSYQAEFLAIGFTSTQKAEPYIFTHVFRELLKEDLTQSSKSRLIKEQLNP
ncbi:MAG: hypothetical protein ACKO96_18180, partial [Flammeovirgaceae bacterium]